MGRLDGTSQDHVLKDVRLGQVQPVVFKFVLSKHSTRFEPATVHSETKASLGRDELAWIPSILKAPSQAEVGPLGFRKAERPSHVRRPLSHVRLFIDQDCPVEFVVRDETSIRQIHYR